MKIDKYLDVLYNDFTADLVCEHCGSHQTPTSQEIAKKVLSK